MVRASARVAMTKINRKVLSITPGLVPHSLLYKLIRTKVRHSRMLLAGIQARPGLDPRLKHSGVTPLGINSHGYVLIPRSFLWGRSFQFDRA